MKRALRQSQAAELLRAASMIAPGSRDGFLREVDGRLRGIRRQLTDEDVAAAIIAVVGAVAPARRTHRHRRRGVSA